jgi:ubiquinone/menaquinone biosynthesis C-methylase UbiE
MNPDEYVHLERVEKTHWYYAGKRELVRRWIFKTRLPTQSDVLLDCGAGTGIFAASMESYCRVLVLDDHEDSLRLLRQRFRAEQILALAGDKVPLPDGSLYYVTALDVLEHVADDSAVPRQFHRLLKTGGIVVVTVPASMALWSDWDEALHHHRRYDRAQLSRLSPAEQWEIVHINYTNVLVYPLVWAVRRWRRWIPESVASEKTEHKVPPDWINHLLRAQFVKLACVRLPMPFGVSLLLVARKR